MTPAAAACERSGLFCRSALKPIEDLHAGSNFRQTILCGAILGVWIVEAGRHSWLL